MKVRAATSGDEGLAEHLMYQALDGDGSVVRLRDGAVLGGLWFWGPDIEACSPRETAQVAAFFNAAVRRLGEGWMLHVETVRRRDHGYHPQLEGVADAVDVLIEEERRDRAAHFRTDHALFLTYRASRAPQRRFGRVAEQWIRGAGWRELGRSVLSAVRGDDPEALVSEALEEMVEFEKGLSDVLEALDRAGVGYRRMRPRGDNNELLQALNYVVNGEWQTVRAPEGGWFLDVLLARDLLRGAGLQHAAKHVRIVAPVGFPEVSRSAMLEPLCRIGVELRWSTRFICQDYLRSRKQIGQRRNEWRQKRQGAAAQMARSADAAVNVDAVRRVQELDEAWGDLESGAVALGHLTQVVVVTSESREECENGARHVLKTFHERGFLARIERYNDVEALLGSFPGHGYHNVRRPVLNTMNLSHMVSLSREWEGETRCPHGAWGSSPWLQGVAASGSRFLFNAHAGDVGHTLVLGATGSGKSALLALLCSQHSRYRDSQVFVFDVGRSMEVLAHAKPTASHYRVGGETGPQLCPLAELDTPEDLAWAAAWVEGALVELGLVVSPAERNVVRRAVRDLAESTRLPSERSLSDLWSHLQSERLKEAFEFYTQGPGGRVLNGERTELRASSLTVFEIDELLNAGPKLYGPTLRYLIRQVEKRLDGRPSVIVGEELWKPLANPLFRAQLNEWLRTLRKKNCSLLMATQSPHELLQSEVAGALLQSCPTRIYCANAEANVGEMRRLYEQGLGLRPVLVDQIAALTPKREYLWVQGARSRIFGVQLGPVALAFCGASGQADLRRRAELAQEHGRFWPRAWLEERGLTRAARRWGQLA